VQILQFGGPEVLHVVDIEPPAPREGFVLIDVEAAGLNYADTHQIENSYLAPQQVPLIPGTEVVGTARDGEHAGRRVVAMLDGSGGYAEQASAPAASVFPIGDDLPAGQALALVLQGTTAWHLLRTSSAMSAGESVVVHAAAGGVGSLAVQLARLWGAGRVIGTASTHDKRDLATSLGADVAVDVSKARIAPQVTVILKKANGGAEVDVVLEMIGGHVFDGSVNALAPMGRLVAYGSASRTAASPVKPGILMSKSRAVIGFWLVHVARRPGGLGPAMSELLALVRDGALRPVLGGTYPLEDVAKAHDDLLGRRSVGKLVLDVAGAGGSR
jgi:NADPH2:quinone reductase